MMTITHDRIHELVKQLPERKLQVVYSLLLNFTKNETETSSPQIEFMRLPQDERRRAMAQQAEKIVLHYKHTEVERQEWQTGDFMNDY
jgi:hypothetical protein